MNAPPAPSARRRRLGLKLALASVVALLTLVLGLFLLERWVERENVWGVSFFRDVQRYLNEAIEPMPEGGPEGQLFQNRPNVDLALRTFRYRTDAWRLRRGMAEPIYAPDSFEGLRILCVGDSVTLGWGVDDELTWVRLVEREGRAPDGRAVACLNTGHLMYDTQQEAELLDAWGELHRPDVVVLTYVYNDLQPTYEQAKDMTEPAQAGTPEEPRAQALVWRSPGWLKRRLPHLVQLASFWEQMRAFQGPDRWKNPPFSYYPSGWPRSEAALERIRARCETLGARLVLLETNQFGPPLVELAAWCERNGVPHVSITFTPEEYARGVQNSYVDAHANQLGNRLIADKVQKALRELGILAAG